MALNLVRNSRVFFTTNVNSDGVVNTTGITTSNTWEIQVLDGLSFSQATTSETVTVNEAGATPTRGQRSFNTALNPVEFSMSTYIRPKLLTAPDPDEILAEERFLWNAFAGVDAIGTAAGAVGWTTGASSSTVAFTNSNKHQFQKFGLIIVIDGAAYLIDNCSLNQASIDFGLDAIATIAWSGQGTALRQLETVTLATNTFSGGLTGTATGKVTDAKYLANKLSTVTIQAGITGTGTTYTLPVTGGNITFANNITYLTPANLGIVNQPITYFSGTRAISGSLNCYLRTNEENSSADLLNALLTGAATDIAPGYEITISIGGSSGTRVVITMPAAVLQIPSVNTEQVVSTTINFTAQGSASTAYDITAANEAEIKYYATA
jgi:hypothetical protein